MIIPLTDSPKKNSNQRTPSRREIVKRTFKLDIDGVLEQEATILHRREVFLLYRRRHVLKCPGSGGRKASLWMHNHQGG
jgi:hypothetical protein